MRLRLPTAVSENHRHSVEGQHPNIILRGICGLHSISIYFDSKSLYLSLYKDFVADKNRGVPSCPPRSMVLPVLGLRYHFQDGSSFRSMRVMEINVRKTAIGQQS